MLSVAVAKAVVAGMTTFLNWPKEFKHTTTKVNIREIFFIFECLCVPNTTEAHQGLIRGLAQFLKVGKSETTTAKKDDIKADKLEIIP